MITLNIFVLLSAFLSYANNLQAESRQLLSDSLAAKTDSLQSHAQDSIVKLNNTIKNMVGVGNEMSSDNNSLANLLVYKYDSVNQVAFTKEMQNHKVDFEMACDQISLWTDDLLYEGTDIIYDIMRIRVIEIYRLLRIQWLNPIVQNDPYRRFWWQKFMEEFGAIRSYFYPYKSYEIKEKMLERIHLNLPNFDNFIDVQGTLKGRFDYVWVYPFTHGFPK